LESGPRSGVNADRIVSGMETAKTQNVRYGCFRNSNVLIRKAQPKALPYRLKAMSFRERLCHR